MKHTTKCFLIAVASISSCGQDPSFREDRDSRQVGQIGDSQGQRQGDATAAGAGGEAGAMPGANDTAAAAPEGSTSAAGTNNGGSGSDAAGGSAEGGANGSNGTTSGSASGGGSTSGIVPPVTGPAACLKRRLLLYSLQPAGTAVSYETIFSHLVPELKTDGYYATYANRSLVPEITAPYINQFDLVVFVSGCGGATGLSTAAELSVIRNFYLSGKSLSIVTDDDQGDPNAPGSCQPRANAIANNFGVHFSGFQDNISHGCKLVQATNPILSGIALGRFTSAYLSTSGPVSWGSDSAEIIGTLSNGTYAEGFIDAKNGHGAVLFSPDFGSLSCDGRRYLANLVKHLGCK